MEKYDTILNSVHIDSEVKCLFYLIKLIYSLNHDLQS